MILRNITNQTQRWCSPKCVIKYPIPQKLEYMSNDDYNWVMNLYNLFIDSIKTVSYTNIDNEVVEIEIFAECDEEHTPYEGEIDRAKATTRFDTIWVDISEMTDEEVVRWYNYYELGGDIAPDIE